MSMDPFAQSMATSSDQMLAPPQPQIVVDPDPVVSKADPLKGQQYLQDYRTDGGDPGRGGSGDQGAATGDGGGNGCCGTGIMSIALRAAQVCSFSFVFYSFMSFFLISKCRGWSITRSIWIVCVCFFWGGKGSTDTTITALIF